MTNMENSNFEKQEINDAAAKSVKLEGTAGIPRFNNMEKMGAMKNEDDAIKTEKLEKTKKENNEKEEKKEKLKNLKTQKENDSDEKNIEKIKNEDNVKKTNNEDKKIKEGKTLLGLLKPLTSLFVPIFKNFGNIISIFIRFVRSFLLTAYNTETDFITHFEQKYGKYHVNFFKGSYKKAILEANKSNKLMILYCHLEKIENNYFCEYIFTDSKVKDFIDDNFIVHAEYVTTREEIPIINIMKKRISFPALLITLPFNEFDVKVLRYINGSPTINQIIDVLSQCIEDVHTLGDPIKLERQFYEGFLGNPNAYANSGHVQDTNIDFNNSHILGDRYMNNLNREVGMDGNTRLNSTSRNGLVKRNVNTGTNLRNNRNVNMAFRIDDIERNITDRLIREEQDREYQEAVLVDKMREAKKQEQQLLKRLKTDTKKEIREKRKEKSKKFKLQINEGEQTTKICSRFPNGKRIQQNFSIEHTIQDIYDWVECSEFLENDVKVPYKFELICGHSKITLEKNENKIKHFDLFPNAILNVKSLDSSDEE